MEVHQHTHSARKKWTHYFWEFLMLFLAVFCGFLAEYQLEHTIENNREMQYIRSFLDDIKSDTSILDAAINLRARRMRRCDSLITLLTSKDRNQQTDVIYSLALVLSSSNRFGYNDRTVHQLKNSGGMRLIRKQGASDSIINYDLGMRRMQLYEDQSLEVLTAYRSVAAKVFDASVFLAMVKQAAGGPLGGIKPSGKPRLLTDDPKTINEMCTQLLFYRQSNDYIRTSLTDLLATATRTIDYLEKKYGLD